MIRLLCAILVLIQSNAYATTRNLGITDHPRYKYMKGNKGNSSSSSSSSSTRAKRTPAPDKRYRKAHILTLDTRETAICDQYAQTLMAEGALTRREGADLCLADSKNPYVSLIVESEAPQARGWKFSELSPREQDLAKQTRNFFVPAVGMMVLLFALPKSFTGWDSFDQNDLTAKWKRNVKSGPVMDHDKWAVNYIGHPYAGAAYYVVARHAGFSKTESFAYSAFMSTFFWEYGVEAFAEKPSIQDLISTPLLGALLGELFIKGEQVVRANNNKVLGSEFLGSTALFLMNPAGGVLDASDRLLSRSPFTDAEFQIYSTALTPQGDARVGFNMVLWLKK